MDVRFLELAEVLEIHADQIDRYGGSDGIRDMDLLQSAVSMPEAGIAGTYAHGTLYEMAAAYFYHLVRNHPFVDGNKRTALASALVFLDLNSVEIRADADELVAMVEATATHDMEKAHIAAWFEDHAG
jgi:death-on-curing protein